MTTRHLFEPVLWVGALLLGSVAIMTLQPSKPGPDLALSTPALQEFEAPAIDVDSEAELIAAGDAFRAARHSSPIPFSPQQSGASPPAPKPAPPSLIVSGIVGGPPWSAIIEGVPGRSSLVVRSGDTLSGFKVRRIARDTVVLAGVDTVLVLAVRRGLR